MTKRWIAIGLVALLLTAAPMVIMAQAGASGTGTVTASGDGRAGLRGSGDLTISGSGVLLIIDHAGDAVIDVSGEGSRYERGSRILYRGFNGTAAVSGSDITVGLRGTGITLEASGTGIIRLWGTGTYEINGESGDWSQSGSSLPLGQ